MSLSNQINRIKIFLRTHRTTIVSGAACLLLGFLIGVLLNGGAEVITETITETQVDTVATVDTVMVIDTVVVQRQHESTMVDLEGIFDEYPELSNRDKRKWRKSWMKADRRIRQAEEKAYKQGYKDGADLECGTLKGENKQLKRNLKTCEKANRRQQRIDGKVDRTKARQENKRVIPGWVWPVGIFALVGGVVLFIILKR